MTTSTRNNIDPNATDLLVKSIALVDELPAFDRDSVFKSVLSGQVYRITTLYADLLVDEKVSGEAPEPEEMDRFYNNVVRAQEVIAMITPHVTPKWLPTADQLRDKTVPKILERYYADLKTSGMLDPSALDATYGEDDFKNADDLAAESVVEDAYADDTFIPSLTPAQEAEARESVRQQFIKGFEDCASDILKASVREVMVCMSHTWTNTPASRDTLAEYQEYTPDVYQCRSLVSKMAKQVQAIGIDAAKERQAVKTNQPAYVNRYGSMISVKNRKWLYEGKHEATTASGYMVLKDTWVHLDKFAAKLEALCDERSTNTNPDIDDLVAA